MEGNHTLSCTIFDFASLSVLPHSHDELSRRQNRWASPVFCLEEHNLNWGD